MDRPEYERAVQRMFEDESLTADLVDPAAQLLLEWGVAQAERMLSHMAGLSREQVVVRLNLLRRVIRTISRIAGQAPPDGQLQQVRALTEALTHEDFDAAPQ